MAKKQKVKIMRNWFIPWILEEYNQQDIIDAWSTGENIEDFALGIAGMIPINHIENWGDVKHHWDDDLKDDPRTNPSDKGFNSWSAYYEDDGYVEHVPNSLKVEWVNG